MVVNSTKHPYCQPQLTFTTQVWGTTCFERCEYCCRQKSVKLWHHAIMFSLPEKLLHFEINQVKLGIQSFKILQHKRSIWDYSIRNTRSFFLYLLYRKNNQGWQWTSTLAGYLRYPMFHRYLPLFYLGLKCHTVIGLTRDMTA